MSRHSFRWTVNECLQLQREYELLELSIDEIAERHKRTPHAIMYKLDAEGFGDFNTLYYNYHNKNKQNIIEECSSLSSDDNDEDSISVVKSQLSILEQRLNSLTEIITKRTSGFSSLFA